jgi:hypothetical protein
VKGGDLTVFAKFTLAVVNVNPFATLSDLSSGLSSALQVFGSDFESITEAFGSTFSSASDMFLSLSQSDRIDLLFDANIDFEVSIDLSLDSVQVSAYINKLSSSLYAAISHEFDLTLSPFDLHITPNLQVNLHADNTATPFDVLKNASLLNNFSIGGDFLGQISVGVDGVPAEVTLTASVNDIVNASTLGFDLKLDIDLLPIKDVIIDLLEEIADFSYPKWLISTAPFLPEIKLACIANSGISFLSNVNATSATISDFLGAISSGCASNSFALSGGYDADAQQLVIGIVVELGGSRNL